MRDEVIFSDGWDLRFLIVKLKVVKWLVDSREVVIKIEILVFDLNFLIIM